MQNRKSRKTHEIVIVSVVYLHFDCGSSECYRYFFFRVFCLGCESCCCQVGVKKYFVVWSISKFVRV